MYKVSIGVCCYNEEANIGELLSLLTHETILNEIIVIASGCTDRTVEIAKTFKQVRVLEQEKREGKASAVNLFIQEAVGDILILESADTLPLPNAIQKLIEPFEDFDVGAVGGHPKPLNASNSIVGYTVQLIWELHHLTSLEHPKIGEAIAFRRAFHKIPHTTLVDEACIDSLIRGQGYRIVYVPDAMFLNRGPQTLKDLIRQRKRIHLGHLYSKTDLGFEVPTLNPFYTMQLLVKHGYFLRSPIGTSIAIGLEAYCRYSAKQEYKKHPNTSGVWDVSNTTKQLASKE
jgi:biofilm PGA synthesis N-glycosyltransferase PgaC